MSDIISLYNFQEEEFYVVLRNLGQFENLSVVSLLKQFQVDQEQQHHQTQKSHNMKKSGRTAKSKKIVKKSDIIRQKNSAKKIKKLLQEDEVKLTHYMKLQKVTEKSISDIQHFKTDFGKNRMKYILLKLAYDSQDFESLLELYLQLIHVDPNNDGERKLRRRVSKLMNKRNYKEIQFEFLYNRLPPLDFYNNYEKKLEPWQAEVLQYIMEQKDVLVCAKTSMGKTWLAMYPGLIGKRVLFIVPTRPLAYQVAAGFMKHIPMGVSVIVKDVFLHKNSNRIVVGTPEDVEHNLFQLDTIKFDIMVCDEIHNLNFDNGDAYERLIKLFAARSRILALSATIGNAAFLQDWFTTVCQRPTQLVQHSVRFLNLQRHVWFQNRELQQIHPLSCLTFDTVSEEFLTSNIPFTPNDNVQLFRALEKFFGAERVQHLQLTTVFPQDNKRLSLDDSKHYEMLLKTELLRLKMDAPEQLRELLREFHRPVEMITGPINLYNLLKHIKSKNMTPCIIFQLNKFYCKEIFETIIYYLEKLELLNYPHHYDNLEWMHEYYVGYTTRHDLFQKNIKLGKNTGSDSKTITMERMVKRFEQKEVDQYILKFQDRIQRQIKTISETPGLSEKVKRIQIANLRKTLDSVLDTKEIKDVDVFEKHPDFCMNSLSPMSANEIRQIRKKMCLNLNLKIDYNNVYMQGLKRGIGIYTEDMPEIYNQAVQTLAQNGELGFCISDRTLGLGINMPFRSACLLGYKDSTHFTTNDYQQFIGRAGRRGMDKEGHVIYCNVDWKMLMQGRLGNVVGKPLVLYNYPVLEKISNYRPQDVQRVFGHFVNSSVQIQPTKVQHAFFDDREDNIVLWKLRYFNDQIRTIIQNMDTLEMTFKKEELKQEDVLALLKLFLFIFYDHQDFPVHTDHYTTCELQPPTQELFQALKLQRIHDNQTINVVLTLCTIMSTLHNQYSTLPYYQHITKLLRSTFNYLKLMLNKENCLSSKRAS